MAGDLEALTRRVADALRQQPLDPRALTVLQRRLEATWQPDGGLLLRARSVSGEALGDGAIATGEERTRLVRGEVSGAGAVVRGRGFTAARTGVGAYTVTYVTPYREPATPTFGQGAGGINLTANNAGSFSVQTFNTATGAALDTGWTFIVIGV